MPTSSELAVAFNAAKGLIPVLSGLRALSDACSSPPTPEQVELFQRVRTILPGAVSSLHRALSTSVLAALTEATGGTVAACGRAGANAHVVIYHLGNDLVLGLFAAIGHDPASVPGQYVQSEFSADNQEAVQRALAHLDRGELQLLEAKAERETFLAAGRSESHPGAVAGAGEGVPETDQAPEQAKAPGVSWQDVQQFLDECRLKGERFTSCNEMAGRVGCSPATVHKAIGNGPVELQDWAKKRHAPSRLNVSPEAAAVALGKTPQSREPSLGDAIEQAEEDAAMEYLRQEARKTGPAAVARIEALDPAARRKMAELVYRDSDHAEQAERLRKAKRLKQRN